VQSKSKRKPLTDDALEKYEAKRDIGAELVQAIREMKAGQGRIASTNPKAVLAVAPK